MQLTINGETHRVPADLTVSGLLAHLAIDNRQVAVEKNGVIIPRSRHEHETLAEADAIELVRFIGGG